MSSDWVADDFPNDPDIQAGYIGANTSLSHLETMALMHLHQTEANYRKFCRGFEIDIYPIAANGFVSKTLISNKRKRAVVVISLGFVRLIITLAVRVSLRLTRGQHPYGISSTEMLSFEEVGTPKDSSLHEFSLQLAKRVASGLTKEEIEKSLTKLRGAKTLAAIEYTAAALEFVTLHEIAHTILRHREVSNFSEFWNALEPALQRLGPEFANYGYMPRFRFDRAFEHAADYTAMMLMWTRAPLRITSLTRDIQHLHSSLMSRRSLGVVGAGVAFAAIALIGAPEPVSELQITLEASQGHPSPMSRLPVATTLLIQTFQEHPIRRLLSGLPLKGHADLLNLMQYAVNFHSMSAIRAQWEEIVESPEILPAWLFKLYDTTRVTDFTTSEVLEDVMKVQSLSKQAKKSWKIELDAN